jgi:hypothetical protein
MTIVKSSDVDFVENNITKLKQFIRKNFAFQDREQMENIFLTFEYVPFVKKLIIDQKRTNEEKMDLLMYKIFSGFSLIVLLGAMGQGKGTTSASLIQYAKGDNPRGINYLKKFKISQVVGLIPCPELPFIEDYVWDISQIPQNSLVYCPEMALVFGNTQGEYAKNETSQVPKELLKLRQKGVRFIGESQNDNIVNVTFFKFLDSYMYRYISPKSAKFGREQNIITNPLIPYIMPPSAIDEYRKPILDNLTTILYDDDHGFISVKIPRTEKYTKEMSESFKDSWSFTKDHILKAIKEDGEDFLKLKEKLEARGVIRTPKEWKSFCVENEIKIESYTPTQVRNL